MALYKLYYLLTYDVPCIMQTVICACVLVIRAVLFIHCFEMKPLATILTAHHLFVGSVA